MIKAVSGLGTNKVEVELSDTSVTIKKGMFGRNETKIPLRNITAVNIKQGHFGGVGSLEFVAAGLDGVVSFSYWRRQDFVSLAEHVSSMLDSSSRVV